MLFRSLACVLNSQRAVDVSILVVRAFVKLRQLLSTNKGLLRQLMELEKKYQLHDRQIIAVYEVLQKLMEPEEASADTSKPRIGFSIEESKIAYRIRKRKSV